MKVTAGRVDAVLEKPNAETLVLLIYGPDAGLVRERADRAVTALIGTMDDPFRGRDPRGKRSDQGRRPPGG